MPDQAPTADAAGAARGTAASGAPEATPAATATAPPAALPATPNDSQQTARTEGNSGSNLEDELKRVTEERNDLRQRLELAEVEVARLRATGSDGGGGGGGGGGGEGGEEDENAKLLQDNQQLRATLRKATDLLREKVTMCVNQEKRNRALVQQVASLKDVLAVTRDLLNIRNMEVEHLQKDVDSMEGKIEENRRNQNHLITQMEKTSKINQALKTEYETQLKIFQQLKERYEEKVDALTHLNAIKADSSEVFVDAQDQIPPSQS